MRMLVRDSEEVAYSSAADLVCLGRENLVNKALEHLSHQICGCLSEQFVQVGSWVDRMRTSGHRGYPFRGDVGVNSKGTAVVAHIVHRVLTNSYRYTTLRDTTCQHLGPNVLICPTHKDRRLITDLPTTGTLEFKTSILKHRGTDQEAVW